MEIEHDGILCMAMLDSGAGVSVMDIDMVRKLGGIGRIHKERS